MRIIILGPAGVGKSTLGARLGTRLGVPHVSLGDAARQLARSESPTGEALRRYWEHPQWRPLAGPLAFAVLVEALGDRTAWILDGYPRDARQLASLPQLPTLALLLVAPRDLCEARAIGRGRDGTDDPRRYAARWQADEARFPALMSALRRAKVPLRTLSGELSADEVLRQAEEAVAELGVIRALTGNEESP